MSHRCFAVWLVLSCTAIVLVTPLSGSERSRSEPRLSTASRSIVVTTAADMTPGSRPATRCSPGFMSGCSKTVGTQFKLQL